MTAAASPLDRALVEEAAKKSSLVWVRGEGTDPARALWHVWHEGAVLLVGDGPGEQPLPGLAAGGAAEVTVRSKDKGVRLVTFRAGIEELTARSPGWEAAVGELRGKRLNAADAERMPERWARECRVLRLVPAYETGTLPAPDSSLAAPPPPSPASTRVTRPAPLPKLVLGRRRKKR
ncbi:hypothetical protein [Streptomyces sp. SPB074]|uniref:hypothetical protein n=1 Tax=Streptomyces sp. (strain SPB074) TaxID=465543 RepID=UPI0001D1DDC7|nr:hypothetical protein [Streptomyces sp. SPB074]EFG64701.1 conserved hypothetical protein [Streptomyces sp. SPB074]